jgi:hypothetical protein
MIFVQDSLTSSRKRPDLSVDCFRFNSEIGAVNESALFLRTPIRLDSWPTIESQIPPHTNSEPGPLFGGQVRRLEFPHSALGVVSSYPLLIIRLYLRVCGSLLEGIDLIKKKTAMHSPTLIDEVRSDFAFSHP